MLEACFTRAVEVLGVVVLRAADHLPLHQGLVPIAFGAYQVEVGRCCCNLGPARVQLQAHVLGVEFGQCLVGLDPLPFIYQSSADFATDAKCQVRLITRSDFTGVAVQRLRRRLWLDHHGRAHGGLHRLFVTACR
ncbi:hypothetical protein D3C81_1952960 [compost metagenome]